MLSVLPTPPLNSGETSSPRNPPAFSETPFEGVAERREPEAHTMSLGVETPLLSALLLARLGVISACFSPQRRVRSHFSGAWGELAQSACTWR